MKKLLLVLIVLGSYPTFAAAISKQISLNGAGTDCVKANLKLDQAIKEASKNKKVISIKIFECEQQFYDTGEVEFHQGAHLNVEIDSVIGNF